MLRPSVPPQRSGRSRVVLLLASLASLTLGACKLDRRPDLSGDTTPLRTVSTTGRRLPGTTDRELGVEIRALLIDPGTVRDEQGEWIELRNPGTHDMDLAGWRLESGGDPGFTFPANSVILSGGRLDLGRSTDPAKTGGIRIKILLNGITLDNGQDWVALRDGTGKTVDSVAWTRSIPDMPITHRPARRPNLPAEDAAGTGRPPELPPAPTDTGAPTAGTGGKPDDADDDGAVEQAGGEVVDQRGRRDTAAPLVVRVLDVGQGDAILIENGGSTVLVDGGPDARLLGRHLDALGIGRRDTIDAVILSHPHADHYLGLQELFRSRRRLVVRFLWEGQDASPNRTLARLRDSIEKRVDRGELTYRDTDDPCADGSPTCTITLRGGARLHILRPDPRANTANDRSAAVKLVGPDSASFTMWLAGDAEREAIAWFVAAGYARRPGMRVDVLKADHHGSCNGVTPGYLALTRPTWMVASLAADNEYGHMHAQAKATYRAAGVPWYRTDVNGTITIRSPGTPGGGYTITPERGDSSADGRGDRRARSRCEF